MRISKLFLISGMAIVGIFFLSVFYSDWSLAKSSQNANTEENDGRLAVQKDPLEIEVILQRHYMDGKVEADSHKETVWAMEDFWAYYDGWQVIDQKEGEIIFRKEVADISPYMKENGYFGLRDGQLTIFEGLPMHEQVIQSFYQIDTKELESYQAKQLREGIKIDSKQVYQYVLEAYRDMAPSPSRSVNS
ncbi:intercompartmental signaling factor BofC [Sediminibacillus massiliensis]|uniref:intercompartmental signaling factor BofC n=1 Tax=Sediminibacillus massiliensis TaxID=1926277 RepID=UPI00098851FD|nr:intercompartmental signaling factor BofC [Sediminibacillus massiliensis]